VLDAVDGRVQMPQTGGGVADSEAGVDGTPRPVLCANFVVAGKIAGLSELPFSLDEYGSGKRLLAEAKACWARFRNDSLLLL
jgi:hypothetical protein